MRYLILIYLFLLALPYFGQWGMLAMAVLLFVMTLPVYRKEQNYEFQSWR